MVSLVSLAWIARRGSLALIVAALTVLLIPGLASAHERRTIASNKADAVVGWLVEPALADQPNGVDLRLARSDTKEPMEGLEKTLKVEISQGGLKKTFDVRARFGMKGAYTVDLTPTRVGDYTFRVFGEIDGVKVDEAFESGPGRFDGVKPISGVQFPVIQPTAGELQASLVDARAAADTARMAAFAGIGVGVIGLLVGLVALLQRGRTSGSARAS